jgi:hypothetical protein
MYLEKRGYVSRIFLTETEKAYIAGLFDGEGCVSMHIRKPVRASREKNDMVVVQITLGMTNRETIEWLCKLTGTPYVTGDRSGRGWKDIYIWRPNMTIAYDVMEQVYPYLITKKRNVELFLELMDIRSTSTRFDSKGELQRTMARENMALNGSGD